MVPQKFPASNTAMSVGEMPVAAGASFTKFDFGMVCPAFIRLYALVAFQGLSFRGRKHKV